ncbi:dna-directed rna polymerases i ii and iii subunit rpabc2 [Holotrichia oblita]|uniref:Dna-directed rna polymerases i ii and iii subunit rpabc2 n=1 Tax=Holotrichia oblita TaxID=644536 RepID=A0ACB9TS43_HOLOL|nr:dna-directed rna polymerases i ii and iii subunit rpabc2 [Holotrichia oblita]
MALQNASTREGYKVVVDYQGAVNFNFFIVENNRSNPTANNVQIERMNIEPVAGPSNSIYTGDFRSELNSNQELTADHVNEILFDSDCSVNDKDYIPDVLSASTSDEDEQCHNKTIDDVLPSCQQRTRWKKSIPSQWKKNKIKKQKLDTKAPKRVDCSKCRFKCMQNLSEESRIGICKTYWQCDYKRQKDFILNNVESHVPERRRERVNNETRPRLDSKEYFFSVNSNKIRVCKDFFLKTLCICKEVVDYAFANKGELGMFTGEDNRGKKEPYNKTPAADIDKVKQHIESFPVMESHYVRKSTQRKYLDCKLNITKMHSLYLELCEKDKSKPVSILTYRRIFCNNYNLSFFVPRKDQCQLCVQYNSSSTDKKQELEDKYRAHITRKEDCNAAKAKDKERSAKESNFVCCTFDLECVLQIPSNDVNAIAAKKKDLLKLCKTEVIPEEYHPWYKALPSSKAVKDQIPAPAASDSTSEDSEIKD